jgi:hypothetical protein
MFIVLIAIQVVLMVYAGQDPINSDIWEFVTNLQNWGSLKFILSLVGIAAGIGIIGIAAASTFGFKTDFLIFAPAVAGFITMGLVLTNLGRAIADEIRERFFSCLSYAGDAGVYASCITNQNTIVTIAWAISVGPLALYYVWTIVEWWRGRDF